MKLVGTLDFTAPFGAFVEADTADPTRYTVWVTQTGLGMPNRDYYLNKGPKFDGYRAAYLAYVTKVFELVGDPKPADSAKRVIALENKIAQVAWAEERRRNVSETNNPMDLRGAEEVRAQRGLGRGARRRGSRRAPRTLSLMKQRPSGTAPSYSPLSQSPTGRPT